MARDDLGDLDDDERELIRKARAERAKAQQEDDYEVEVGDKDGNYYRGPRSKVRKWAQARGFEEPDPDPEPEDEDEPEAKPKRKAGPAKEGGNRGAFRAGRRISLDGAPHLRDKK